MNKRNFLFSLAAIALLTVVIASPAFAANSFSSAAGNAGSGGDIGADFFTTLQGMITGNVGFFIGLAVTVLGIWTWVIKQQTGAGVIMIIGGVLITLAPGLFNSAREFTASVISNVGGNSSSTSFSAEPVN